ncbi:MAG TPA: substrate-binding domain-containing protein [Acetobacteraceae bacterium]|jgi:branched-chain amino acid transport system substrate-binding protein|nr:substrate-binding domain-containing protein [Acetobacteraceae bacterium]
MRKPLSIIAAALALAVATPAGAQQKPIKIALIEDSTGPLEAYAKQAINGFMLGLEYATHGTNTVAGRKIEVIQKDSQTKPDLGRSLLAEAYEDNDADLAVGGSSSAVALAMLPVAQENKKVLIVEPAVADSITGDKWNRYIFHTARNSTQDAISNALAIGKPGVSIATLGQDYAFGRDGVAAFREALKPTGAKLVAEEYAPPTTTDFTAPAQRLFDALKNEPGRKIIWVIWAGADPMQKLKALNPERYGIELATGGNILPVLKQWKDLAGMEGATYYYYGIPKNPVNDWLVTEHQKRFGAPPDFFTAGGMAAAMAAVAALEKTKGDADAEKLIPAMEGMSFQTPKGTMTFRPQDHQALQSMYGFKLADQPNVAWAVPVLTHEFTADEMHLPIRNGK